MTARVNADGEKRLIACCVRVNSAVVTELPFDLSSVKAIFSYRESFDACLSWLETVCNRAMT